MKTAVFTSSDVVFARHDGETVRVLQELTADEASDPTGGQMYRIRFQDGTEAEAYADELKKMRTSRKRSVSLSVDQATAMIAAVRKTAENCGGKVPEGVDSLGYLSAVGLIADAFFLRKPRGEA